MAVTASKSNEPTKSADSTSASQSPLTERSVSAAHEAIDHLSERLARTESSVRGMVNDSSQNFSEKQDEMREQFDSSLERAKSFTKENPLMAAGIAFAAGAVVSALLRR